MAVTSSVAFALGDVLGFLGRDRCEIFVDFLIGHTEFAQQAHQMDRDDFIVPVCIVRDLLGFGGQRRRSRQSLEGRGVSQERLHRIGSGRCL